MRFPAWTSPALVSLLCVLGASGCSWFPFLDSEKKARDRAPELHVGDKREGTLHCDQGRCSDWYRLVVKEHMTVLIEANAPADPLFPDFAMVLTTPGDQVLANDVEPLARPRQISRPLAPGYYFLHITGTDQSGDLMGYKLSVAGQSKPAAKKPAPTRKRRTRKKAPAPRKVVEPRPPIDCDWIEIERDGGEPVSVLLECGIGDGVEVGMAGRLAEGGEVIGEFEISHVYAAGSRAKLVGGLKRPITHDTAVEIQR